MKNKPLLVKIMRITFLQLLTVVFLAGNVIAKDGKAQAIMATKVSVNENNIQLSTVLRELEQKYDINFVYSPKLVNVTQMVSVNAHRVSLADVLKQILTPLKLNFEVSGDVVVIRNLNKAAENDSDVSSLPVATEQTKGQAQIPVKGKVSDEGGNALAGVTVLVKGTGIGTVTDVKGNYSINVPNPTDTLVFSFVSYQTQHIVAGNGGVIDISLIAITGSLKEVIVVGYGTQSKSKVSGAITTVSAKEVALSPAPNLANGLAGRVPGVIINDRGGEAGNDAISINIRGVSTNGNSSPLYVIDGIVRDYGELSFIPPGDVESITVLKDASAAIYGSRAANGVILVTTKRGKTGKATVGATYNEAWVQPERYLKMANSATFAKMSNAEDEIEGLPDKYSANDVALYANGSDPLNHPNTNWFKLVQNNWERQERADVNVSGGSDNTKYYLGTGYLHDGSPFVDGFTYDKEYHLISNVDAQINKNLKISLGITGRVRDNVQSHMDWGNLFLSAPTFNGIYPNGLIGPGPSGSSAVLMSRDPNFGFQNQTAGNFTSTLSAEYKIPGVEGLALSGNFAYDYDNNYVKNWTGVTYYYLLDQSTNQYNKMQGNVSAPSLAVQFPAGSSVTSNVKLSYAHTFNNLHAVDAFIGYEQNTTNAYSISASRSNYASGSIEELFAGDSNTANQTNNGSSSKTGRKNLFGRALYTYDDKYNLQFQFRYDGSDNFAPGKRWGFFPGVSGNWIISKENFLKDVNWVNNLKLRASWGELGNDNVGAYQYLTSYNYGGNYSFNGTSNQGLVQANTPNPNITWEVAKTTDIGIDANFFNGGLTATVDVFKTVRSNILAVPNASVPAYTGLSLPDENIGKIKNQGIEFDLSTTHKIGGLQYTVEGNFTYAKNTVINIDETPGLPSYQRQTGSSLGTPLLYETAGIFTSQAQINSTPHLGGTEPGDLIFKDINNDGVINSLDQVRKPYSAMPQIIYGLNLNLQYKGFDLILGLQGQAKAYGQINTIVPFDPLGWGNFPQAWATNAWTPANPTGTNPSPHQSFGVAAGSTWGYESMAFLKLKTAEFGYTFSNKLLNKAGLKNAKVFISGANLFFIHDNFKEIGSDPEETNWAWGMDQLRVINLGINFTL